MRKAKIFLLLAAVLIVLYYALGPFRNAEPAVLVKIQPGWNASRIAVELRSKNVIQSPFFFVSLARLLGKSKSFKSGAYLFTPRRYWGIVRKLKNGSTYKVKLTIPEGWTTFQIAERLKENRIIEDMDAFVALVQSKQYDGMLFPETYFLEPFSDPATVAGEMTALFQKNYTPELLNRTRELKLTQRQVLTLASIIEREARLDTERDLISSVYHNRLKKRMPLEADPTVQYALSQGRYWKERLLYADLAVVSPYNTYRRAGLPPGPICHPGLKSIQAALYPATTRFLFFFYNGNREHRFFETYNEHRRNLALKRRVDRRKKAGK